MGRLRALLQAQPAHATGNATAQPDELQVAYPRECNAQLFAFAPPADPGSDREALEERAAIIADGCGMDPAQALQEACWQADRERAWRAFLRDAQSMLDAPEAAREGLLDRYQAEAADRYGAPTAATLAGTLRGWIVARAAEGRRD